VGESAMVGERKEYTGSLKETMRSEVKVKSEKTKEFFFLCVLYLCAIPATKSIGVRGANY
jgi:hypothetical protein